MGTIIGEERHLDDASSSLLMPSPKFKRQKVSAIRDFPCSYSPKDALLCKKTKAMKVQDEPTVDGVLKDVSKDIESCGEKGDICEAKGKGALEKMVQSDFADIAKFRDSSLTTCGKIKHMDEELKTSSVEKLNTLELDQNLGEKHILSGENHALSNDSTEVNLEFPTRLKGPSVEQTLLPHYPIPPSLALKEHKYPPPRRVSAIRDFPSVELNIQEPLVGQSSEFKGRENKFEGNTDHQHVLNLKLSECGGKDESNIGSLPARLPSKITVNVKENSKKSVIVSRTGKSKRSVPCLKEMEAGEFSQPLARGDEGDSNENEELNDFPSHPSSIAGSSCESGPRRKVVETLKLFEAVARRLETNSKGNRIGENRVDRRVANLLKEKGKWINTEKVVGAVPGVEVGDLFSCRTALAVIGIHSPWQAGIDTIKQGSDQIAISVVASGGYDNDVGSSDVLIYIGQGGNPAGTDKQPKDQKLEGSNLALRNCIGRSPVRVTRGFKELKPANNGKGKPKKITTYTYDGLYDVVNYWSKPGQHGKLIYKFELKRQPGQRQLTWKEFLQSKECVVREGCCVDDISNGKEKQPICAINTIDDEKPPPFTYITSMMYPEWCRPDRSEGSNCKKGCSDSHKCACTFKNGGEIPYNQSGAIVLEKPLVYECGPSCSCPPSCRNRVSQHGIKLPLEIFKTESCGWGVRCLSSISSGSFICEYIGELLDEKQAEERVGSDEYLFDIGRNFNDDTTLSDELSALMPSMPNTPANADDVVEDNGFTIDALWYGNIARFINHSCSPNLYAQNVLYDHGDKKVPHIMLFACENIPPLQELAYDYHYVIDKVSDPEGNIKEKRCYCGSKQCTGRMY